MTARRAVERDYILGTADQETHRLGLQHDAWAEIVHRCWMKAGVKPGDKVVDVGSGPGYAAFDLAELVGPTGLVTAVERSARFVAVGKEIARGRRLSNIRFVESDVMKEALPEAGYDAAWCRWVASFVDSPAVLVKRISDAVRPGGVAIFHEYVDYAAWRFAPKQPVVERYISTVMGSWRHAGGEPDVGVELPPLLGANGFRLEHVEPRVYCVRPGDPMWTWIATFVESNLTRLIQLEWLSIEQADAVRDELHRAQENSGTLMLTPMVLEIIARKM